MEDKMIGGFIDLIAHMYSGETDRMQRLTLLEVLVHFAATVLRIERYAEQKEYLKAELKRLEPSFHNAYYGKS